MKKVSVLLASESGVVHTLPLLVIVAAVGIISYLLISSAAPFKGGLFGILNPKPGSQAAGSSPCQFQKSDQPLNVAFCDSFDRPNPNPAGINTRSGDLDGVAWGASRMSSQDSPINGGGTMVAWAASNMNRCGNNVNVGPEKDLQICNGMLTESVNDRGNATVFAWYPKQPFDFAGRTGTVAFDVGNDTEGSHMAWPQFVLTDLPFPAPSHAGAAVQNFARNAFGISLAQDCIGQRIISYEGGEGTGDSWAVDIMWINRSYAYEEKRDFHHVACVKKATQLGQMNHVELRISQNHQEVWASDAGSSVLKLVATSDYSLPLTRGLTWMSDFHYNAGKPPGTQTDHTFAWDNFGFDGPILPRDLTFDVLDAEHSGTGNGGDIGFNIPNKTLTNPSASTLTLQIPGVYNLQNASGAVILYTWWPRSKDTVNISVNGHPAHSVPWAYPSGSLTYSSGTMAVPIPLSEVVNGTNTLVFSDSDSPQYIGVDIANVDLLLVGAGGIQTCVNPSQCSGSSPLPTPTSGPSLPPTPTPIPTPTPPPTPSPTPTGPILGNNTIGSQNDSGDSNSMNGSKVTTGSTGVAISSISVNVGTADASPNNQYQVAVYTDSNGTPGALVAKSGTGVLTGNTWNSLAIAANLSANTSYWLMYNTNGRNNNVNNLKFSPSSTQSNAFSNNGAAFGTWPATFGPATLSNNVFSMFASVGAGATPTPIPTPTPRPTIAPTPIPTPTPPQSSLITITAAGQSGVFNGQTVRPTMVLQVNGSNKQTWNNVGGNGQAGQFLTFTYSSPTKVTHDQVRVRFTNDQFNPNTGQDVNLYVQKINIDGTNFASNAPSVFSNGVWTPSTGCAGGNKQSILLSCTGFFQY